jgi:hypothetical protein
MKQFDDSLLDAALERYHFDKETGHFFDVVRSLDGQRIPTGRFAGTVTPFGVRLTTSKRHVMAHHLAWRIYKGEWPNANIKHRNGEVVDCREENLYSPGAEAAKKLEKKRNMTAAVKFYKTIGVTDNQIKRMQVERVREKFGDFDALDMEYRLGLIDKAAYVDALNDLGKTLSK